jgi:hypothetical protein
MASRTLLGKSVSYWGFVAILILALAGFAFWSGRASASDQPHPTVAAGVDRQSTVVALNGDQAFGLSGYGVYKTYRVQDQNHTCYIVVSLFDRASSIACPK